MDVVHALTSLGAIVDDNAVSLSKIFLFSDLTSSPKHVSQERNVFLFGKLQLRETTANFGDHKDVGGGAGLDIAESVH